MRLADEFVLGPSAIVQYQGNDGFDGELSALPDFPPWKSVADVQSHPSRHHLLHL